ncbi:hypothetical protein CALCODRAFT_538624 [Calocera cornea HHB12733]|uniref:Integrase core domain-containing protein n=1 Tax=Calocera cornea HHB12733 TaxID=1353952 RepID=A0A165EG78_9BASI|nr:hypothetical protein CALCODRAFT_438036 [Calocera cornea HHB12733]KZT58844.1 hypothetical protein CALCODRAFT_538624 [Calocera cornea HHB12733]
MVGNRGPDRGSYIWGSSVHNTRIERLWVDVTNSFGRKWAHFFEYLEAHHRLNPLDRNHIWLLHHLFISDVNKDATIFQNDWNHHTLSLRSERNKRPVVLFMIGCLLHGARGIDLTTYDDPDYYAGPDGYGSEYQLFDEDVVSTSAGDAVPDSLNHVEVTPPRCSLSPEQIALIAADTHQYVGASDRISLIERWRWGFRIYSTMGLV